MTIIEALEKSIEKWEDNLAIDCITHADTSAESCPLCEMFNPFIAETGRDDCGECPIKRYVDMDFCENTPYWDAHRAEADGDMDSFLEYAQEEVGFLNRVLEEERIEN